MNRQNIVKSISTSFPTEWHNATKFGVNQVLMAITLASVSGINRIYRIAFQGICLIYWNPFRAHGVILFLGLSGESEA